MRKSKGKLGNQKAVIAHDRAWEHTNLGEVACPVHTCSMDV